MGADHVNRASCRSYLSIWAVAAAVRLLYLLAARPPFTIYNWDAASSLLENGSLSIEGIKTAALEPLYPLWLASARLLVGERPLLVQALQALVASAGAVYLFKLAVALTGRNQVGAAAAALFAGYPLLIRHSVDGTESALVTTLLIAFSYRFITARTATDATVAGALLGFAVLTRAVAAPLLVLAPLAAAAKNRRAALLMAGSAVVVLAPYMIRNYVLSNGVVPARAGVALFIGNNEYTAGIIPQHGPDIVVPYYASRLVDQGLAGFAPTPLTEREIDDAFRRLAYAEIRSRPFDTLWLKVRNLFYFFSPALVPHRTTTAATTIYLGANGKSTVEHSVQRPLGDRLAYSVSYSIVVALAVVGVYHRRNDLKADALLWWTLVTFAAVHAVFFPATRYRAPVEFVLLFYAAVGAVAGLESYRRGRNQA